MSILHSLSSDNRERGQPKRALATSSTMADQMRGALPTKPHFLQPVLSDVETNFLIPSDFCKYLERETSEEFQLRSRRRRRPWMVRIEGRRMVDGWEEFVRENELHVGDFLVFRYEGDMVFDVTVLGPSACEREYPPLPEDDGLAVVLVEDCGTLASPKTAVFTKSRSWYRPARARADSYVGTMRPSYMDSLYFPRHFVLENELKKALTGILIEDENGKTWPIDLGFKRNSDVVYTLNYAWKPFVKEAGIREGEDFEVRMISKGMKPVLSFRKISENKKSQADKVSKKKKSQADEVSKNKKSQAYEISEHEIEIKPKPAKRHKGGGGVKHFYQTTTWPGLAKSRLVIPLEFAKENDLSRKCGDIFLKNLKGELWSAVLKCGKKGPRVHFYIGTGWKEFALSNGLGVGCRFKLAIEQPEKEVLTFKLCECTPEERKVEVVEVEGSP